MKKIIKFLTCASLSGLFASEMPQAPTAAFQPVWAQLETRAVPYLSMTLIVPGAGVSFRNSHRSFDLDVHSVLLVNMLSASYSELFHFGSHWYGSAGIGGSYITDLMSTHFLLYPGLFVPLRIGTEGSAGGFFDIGVSTQLLVSETRYGIEKKRRNKLEVMPLPQIRAGVSF